ncbi:hypothetical protein C1H46_010400 [Malus baccata]|uniref:Uncharacterized protein n=1 Tax=Malus baccata TaxID=106549 RepID=A0A540MZ43_MALBA|nr:hypothetical protein C1H46_010400 [Malus baccata]
MPNPMEEEVEDFGVVERELAAEEQRAAGEDNGGQQEDGKEYITFRSEWDMSKREGSGNASLLWLRFGKEFEEGGGGKGLREVTNVVEFKGFVE